MPAKNQPRVVELSVILHLPAAAPMIDLASELTGMATRLGGHWEYRSSRAEQSGFHIYGEKSRIEEVHS